jgi:hypothetical protein
MVTLFLCLIKICKMKTDFQFWHYILVSGETHNPAALPPGKDPKNAQNSKLSGHFSIITNLILKFLVHYHKLDKIKFLYMFRAQSAHHQEVDDVNCTYAASGIVALCTQRVTIPELFRT